MKSDNGALGAVKDALNLGSATIDVASSALNATKDVVNQIKNKLVAAFNPAWTARRCRPRSRRFRAS